MDWREAKIDTIIAIGGNNDNTDENNTRVSILQAETGSVDAVTGADGSLLKNVPLKCFKYHEKGYLSNNFPT